MKHPPTQPGRAAFTERERVPVERRGGKKHTTADVPREETDT